MNITIMSREEIEGKTVNAYVISFYDYNDVKANFKSIKSCYIEFNDYDIDECVAIFDTTEIINIIHEAKEKDIDIICQCDYGESRSAGCAAAIKEYYNHNGIELFASYNYYPSKVVYNTVYQALCKN